MYILLLVAVADDNYTTQVMRECWDYFGFEPGCHDFNDVNEVAANHSAFGPISLPGTSDVQGTLCFCDTEMCNGGSALQISDSHNFMIICVLVMVALKTLSAARDD